MTEEASQKPAAGWYPDPSGSSQLRFWDGEQWTQQLKDVEVANETASFTGVIAPEVTAAAAGATSSQPGAAFPGAAQGAAGVPRPQFAHSSQANFFRSLFDLSFAAERSVTTSFVKVIYVIGIVFAVLGWLGGAMMSFGLGGIVEEFGDGGMFIVVGFMTLFLGWIPGFINIVFLRVALEFVTAQIRTSQHTAELVRIARDSEQGEQA